MKRTSWLLIAAFLLAPASAWAAGIEERDIGGRESGGTRLAKADKKVVSGEAASERSYRSSNVLLNDRQGRFRAGLIGPGFAAANRGPGAMMTVGLEGEYFFYERLSAGMQMGVATEFKDYAILNFLPFARYTFDLHEYPRWALYVQAGVGIALYNGKHAAADIAIPGGGFWWQWTDNLSVGADAWFHIFARSNTAVGFAIAPAIRWQF